MGIDLGAGNAVVSVLEGGEPTVITNAEGSRTTPSVVAFAKTGEVLVGEEATRLAAFNVERTIRSIKPHMGTDWDLTVDDRRFIPQQISAFILQKLKREAEAYLGETVDEAVIAVPVSFDEAQRQATREAATIAGLRVLRLVSESTAAGVAYGLDKDDSDRTFVIFDLGAARLDLSVLRTGDGIVEVVAAHGDDHLGGDDWDQRILDHLLRTFQREHGVDLSVDKVASERLRHAAEKARIELSQSPETTINVPYLTASTDGPLHLDLRLTRTEFQRMTADLVDRCKGRLQEVLKDAHITVNDIEHVVLVGGSTRMPAIVDALQASTGRNPNRGVNPDEVVAVGASLIAGVLKGEVRDILLIDVYHSSLGIAHVDENALPRRHTDAELVARIIERHNPIPTRRSEVFTTAEDDQTSVEVQVVQGDGYRAADIEKLAVMELTGLLPAPRGQPRIEVVVDIEADGIPRVSAKDLDTGREISMTVIDPALRAQDLERMVEEAEEYEEEFRRRRDSTETRESAETLVWSTEKFLAEHGAQLDVSLTLEVEEKLGILRDVLHELDPATVRAAKDALAAAAQEMGQEWCLRQADFDATGDDGDPIFGDDDDLGPDIIDEESTEPEHENQTNESATRIPTDGEGGDNWTRPDDWDFFISYSRHDRGWAEWIAWQLEQAGYSVIIQAWHMVPGSNYQVMMNEAIERSRRTVAVLSWAYLRSVFGAAEWQAAQQRDPQGFARRLVPIRVGDCDRPGLLRSIVSFDLFDVGSELVTREHLLKGIRAAVEGHDRPVEAPFFPGTDSGVAVRHVPPFTPVDQTPPARKPAFPTA